MTETWEQLIGSWPERADTVGRDVAETFATLEGAPFNHRCVAVTVKMLAHTCKEEFDSEPVAAAVLMHAQVDLAGEEAHTPASIFA